MDSTKIFFYPVLRTAMPESSLPSVWRAESELRLFSSLSLSLPASYPECLSLTMARYLDNSRTGERDGRHCLRVAAKSVVPSVVASPWSAAVSLYFIPFFFFELTLALELAREIRAVGSVCIGCFLRCRYVSWTRRGV